MHLIEVVDINVTLFFWEQNKALRKGRWVELALCHFGVGAQRTSLKAVHFKPLFSTKPKH